MSKVTQTLEGPQTINVADKTQEILLRALNEADSVVVDCREIGECDLTLVQLLLAARRTAEAQGKSLTLLGPPPQTLAEVLVAAGFGTAESGAARYGSPFWFGEA